MRYEWQNSDQGGVKQTNYVDAPDGLDHREHKTPQGVNNRRNFKI